MIADWRLQIEVDAFFFGRSQAFQSEICILKSKIPGLQYSKTARQLLRAMRFALLSTNDSVKSIPITRVVLG